MGIYEDEDVGYGFREWEIFGKERPGVWIRIEDDY
jgi:hypothetical protein